MQSFVGYFRAPEPTPTNEPEPKQGPDVGAYFNNEAERDRILDDIRRDDAQRGFAERYGTPPGYDLGPSDDEITAAKKAALAKTREEIEQGIERREKEPDRGYERD